MLLFGRVLQGMGFCQRRRSYTRVSARYFDGARLTKAYSQFLCSYRNPNRGNNYRRLFAILLGWALLTHVLILYALAVFIVIYCFLPETNGNKYQNDLSLSAVQKNYAEIFLNRKFITISLAATFLLLQKFPMILLTIFTAKQIRFLPYQQRLVNFINNWRLFFRRTILITILLAHFCKTPNVYRINCLPHGRIMMSSLLAFVPMSAATLIGPMMLFMFGHGIFLFKCHR